MLRKLTALLILAALVLTACGTREEGNPTEVVPQTSPGVTVSPQTEPAPDPAETAYRKVQEHCAELARQEKYAEAVDYLTEYRQNNSGDPRIVQLLDEYLTLYMEDTLNRAVALAGEHRYAQAIAALDLAWKDHGFSECYTLAVKYRTDFGVYNTSILAAGGNNTFLRSSGGAVGTVGRNDHGEFEANTWTDITAISAGRDHVVGLRSDGTVIAAGNSKSGRCSTGQWTHVIAVSAGESHTAALLENGTVVSVGLDEDGQCGTDSLMKAAVNKKAVAVAAGGSHTLVMLEDGSALACGSDANGACRVEQWTDLVAICAGDSFSAGLRTDGTVVAAGTATEQWDLSGWTDIRNLAAGSAFLVGIRSDGTVVSAGLEGSYFASDCAELAFWKDVVYIAAGTDHIVAVDRDGQVLCAGSNRYHQGDFKGVSVQEEYPPNHVRPRISQVRMDHHREVDGEYAEILGLNASGEILWVYTTSKYPNGQLDTIAEIGMVGDRYVFCEYGAVVALDSATGSILWRNEEFIGGSPVFDIGSDGTVYLAGYLGPDFFAVDAQGNTIHRIEMMDMDYCWPISIRKVGDVVAVVFDMGPDYETYESFLFHVDLTDFSYSFQGGIS